MDSKWLTICIVGTVIALFAPLGIMEYSKSQCKVEGIRAGKTADEINNICGK